MSHLTEEAPKRVWFINLPEEVEAATPQDRIAELERENASLRAHAERVGEANDRLVVENAALRAKIAELEHFLSPKP